MAKPDYWRPGCAWSRGRCSLQGGRAILDPGGLSCPAEQAAPPAAAAAAAAGPAPILAVFDIEVVGLKLSEEFRSSLGDYFAMRLAETRAFQLVPRDQLRARLTDEKKGSYQSCYAQSCQIELGRELAAEKTLATKISKLGSLCSVSAGVYDLKRAATDAAATEAAGCSEDELFRSLNKVADKLAKRP